MFFTDEELQEFKRLVKEVKGIELTNEEAEDQGSRLVLIIEEYIKFKNNQSTQVD